MIDSSNPQLESLSVNLDRENTVLSLGFILKSLSNLQRLEMREAFGAFLLDILEQVSHLAKLENLKLVRFVRKAEPWMTTWVARLLVWRRNCS